MKKLILVALSLLLSATAYASDARITILNPSPSPVQISNFNFGTGNGTSGSKPTTVSPSTTTGNYITIQGNSFLTLGVSLGTVNWMADGQQINGAFSFQITYLDDRGRRPLVSWVSYHAYLDKAIQRMVYDLQANGDTTVNNASSKEATLVLPNYPHGRKGGYQVGGSTGGYQIG